MDNSPNPTQSFPTDQSNLTNNRSPSPSVVQNLSNSIPVDLFKVIRQNLYSTKLNSDPVAIYVCPQCWLDNCIHVENFEMHGTHLTQDGIRQIWTTIDITRFALKREQMDLEFGLFN